jgi:hypothetical protein
LGFLLSANSCEGKDTVLIESALLYEGTGVEKRWKAGVVVGEKKACEEAEDSAESIALKRFNKIECRDGREGGTVER